MTPSKTIFLVASAIALACLVAACDLAEPPKKREAQPTQTAEPDATIEAEPPSAAAEPQTTESPITQPAGVRSTNPAMVRGKRPGIVAANPNVRMVRPNIALRSNRAMLGTPRVGHPITAVPPGEAGAPNNADEKPAVKTKEDPQPKAVPAPEEAPEQTP